MERRSVDVAYFVELYRRESDPWNFEHSDYEREKYATSLGVLRERYERAYEIGCSIGVFTAQLAARCGSLLAMDPSPEALARASKRVPANVDLRCGCVPGDFPEGSFDLVTFCEVGFYLGATDLETTKDRIVNALAPNGDILLVHWTPPVRGHAVTAEDVHTAFAADARLRRRAHREHETYVLDLFTTAPHGWKHQPHARTRGDRGCDAER